MGTEVEVVSAEGDWSKVIVKPGPGVEAEKGCQRLLDPVGRGGAGEGNRQALLHRCHELWFDFG